MKKNDEELILFLLKEREEFIRLNDYISEKKLKKNIIKIISRINRKIGRISKRIFVK